VYLRGREEISHQAAVTPGYAPSLTIKKVFAIFYGKPCFYTLHSESEYNILRCSVVDALDG
jgi:hypothetical protein